MDSSKVMRQNLVDDKINKRFVD